MTAPGVGADGVAISGEQAKGIDGSEQLSGDAKPLVMPGQQPLDMNDPSSYVPIMQAMQMGDFNMASQMMGK